MKRVLPSDADIIQLYDEGLAGKQLAAKLGANYNTVQARVSRLARRGLLVRRNLSEAATTIYRVGGRKPPCYWTGRKFSPEHKAKIVAAHTGPKHWAWKGDIAPARMHERGSTLYARWRRAVLSRDARTCFQCGATEATGRKMIAHHIESFADRPDLRYDLDNGITLCMPCHDVCHGIERTKNGLPETET